jgi:fatty-acyl-CoA synthase
VANTISTSWRQSRTLPDLLARHGSVTALIERGRPVTFDALLQESRRVARGLALLDVKAGDRVAVWLPNVPAWLACFFACAQLGAVTVCVNTRFRSHELAEIVSRSGAKVLILWPDFKGIDFAGILAGCDPGAFERLESIVVYGEGDRLASQALVGKPVIEYAALASRDPLFENRAAPESACIIFTTSGTTKAPKFVLHDQQRLARHAFDVARGFCISPDAVVLLMLPLCGVYGLCTALAAIAAGRPIVMSPIWNAEEAARNVVEYGVTHTTGTDNAVVQLLEQSDAERPFPSLRFMGYAVFNPALPDIVERADVRGMKLVGLYGNSEIQALFSRQDENASVAERALAGGKPVSDAARVRARDPESGRVLPHGEAGEVEIYAPASRMVGYFVDPNATHAVLTEDGYYRSGDLGYTQADGRFVYLTRLGDSLRLSGFLVNPAEIEAVVQEAPGVMACQVVGIPRADGLKPVAFVILNQGAPLDEQTVIRHTAARLAHYKVPQRVFPIDVFPVTSSANATKIQKHKLRELAEQLMHFPQSERK